MGVRGFAARPRAASGRSEAQSAGGFPMNMRAINNRPYPPAGGFPMNLRTDAIRPYLRRSLDNFRRGGARARNYFNFFFPNG